MADEPNSNEGGSEPITLRVRDQVRVRQDESYRSAAALEVFPRVRGTANDDTPGVQRETTLSSLTPNSLIDSCYM
jgi:hypothetical protein